MRILLMALLLAASPAWAAKIGVGDTPPPALGVDTAGETLDLNQLEGTVVVLTFWASWCSPCLQELPVLENLQRRVPKDQLRVIAMNIDANAADYKRIMTHLADATLTIARDRKGRIKQRYGVSAIPHMFLIDHRGKVAHMHRGYGPDMLEGFVEEINALLQARASDTVAAAD